MKSEIQIKNSAGVCRIEIEGTIGVPEEWQFDQPEARVATYEKFRDTVRRIAGIDAPQIVVDIRSTGGDVNDALLIHDALCSLDAHITTRCYGYTASAATIIAQAASPGCRTIMNVSPCALGLSRACATMRSPPPWRTASGRSTVSSGAASCTWRGYWRDVKGRRNAFRCVSAAQAEWHVVSSKQSKDAFLAPVLQLC